VPTLEPPPEDWELEAALRALRNPMYLAYMTYHLRSFYKISVTQKEIERLLNKFLEAGQYPIEFTDRELEILEIVRREFLS